MSQSGANTGPVATPKIIIDMMLMEKYHWTPQQIDEIPKMTLDIMMLAINQKLQSDAGIEKIKELEIGAGIRKREDVIGNNMRERRKR